MNPAVAYLMLARGSGRDNATSSWSVHAIETHTGISRGRAAKALETLVAQGLIRVERSGTRPLYRLPPAHEVPGLDPRADLTPAEARAVRQARDGHPVTMSEAERAVAKGWLVRGAAGVYRLASEPAPDPIFLPNALMTGAAGETPPVELVRQTQDPMTLRLLVDLYHAQNLREDGGLPGGRTSG